MTSCDTLPALTPAQMDSGRHTARSTSGMSVSTVVSKPPPEEDNFTDHQQLFMTDVIPADDNVQDAPDDMEPEGPPNFRFRYQSDLMSALGGLWRRRLYTDMTLVCEGKAVRCHKLILAAASPYFHSRLFNGRRETPVDKIFVTNVAKTVLDIVVDYLYTGECPLDLDNAEDILKTACLFQISSLHDMTDLYLSENVDATNCLRLFKLACNTRSPLILDQSRWVISNHFVMLWQTPMFKKLSCRELISVLSQEGLVVPDEDSVCNSILTWLESDIDKRRFMLSEILRHVKLPRQRKEYIKQTLESDKIVKEDVVCQRLMKRVRKAHQTALEDSITRSVEINNSAVKDDVILFIGGIVNEDAKFKCKQQVFAFNLEFRKFYPMASLPMGLDSGVACCRHENDVFVSGLGEARQGFARYISARDLWRVLTPLTIGRRGHAMVSDGQFVYVLGGMVDQVVDGNKRVTSVVERYDIKRNKWNFVASLPESVWGLSAIIVQDSKIVTFGGYHSRDIPTSSVQTFDIKSGLTHVTSQLPFPVALTQALDCGDGAVYIVCPTGNILKTTDCWRFRSVCAVPGFKRAMFGATSHRGRLFLAGGKFNQEAYDDMQMVDLATQSLVALPEKLPQPMYGFGCAALSIARGNMVKMAFE